MKTMLPLLLLLHSAFLLSAQSTGFRVYEIFQQKCVSCHNNASPEAGLDLEGAGASAQAKALNVFNNVFNVTPANIAAAAQGYRYIYPGRPDQSFLFHKVNQGLDPTLVLQPGEGAPMPNYSAPLADVEKELIRQWILFGAPTDGEVVEEQILIDYYNGQGLASFDQPPPAPAPGEGFQLKMGPFFLKPAGQPGSEMEYFLKHELKLPENIEVKRMDIIMSGYSHHFILYNFVSQGAANNVPHGLRTDAQHQGIGFLAAVQESTDLDLPEGTAFFWDKNIVLDFNSHYINYSAGLVYQAESYINVYTQPAGTAVQEMKASLFANLNINIPNDGDLISATHTINYNIGDVYLWGIMGHTHKYGAGYKVYKRVNGVPGEMIYDGACAEGIPGCVSPYFDYQHIPMRYFEPLKPLKINGANGLIHEASWINNGPNSVGWGPTSNDEMMVLIMFYTLDSAGIVIAHTAERPELQAISVQAQPNPMQNQAFIALPSGWNRADFRLFDARGALCSDIRGVEGPVWTFERGALPDGIYLFQLTNDAGQLAVGKLVLQNH